MINSILPFIKSILPYIQVGLSAILVGLILIQRSEAGLGGTLGGSDGFGSQHRTRRGTEKNLFYATIVIAILFAVSAFTALVI